MVDLALLRYQHVQGHGALVSGYPGRQSEEAIPRRLPHSQVLLVTHLFVVYLQLVTTISSVAFVLDCSGKDIAPISN